MPRALPDNIMLSDIERTLAAWPGRLRFPATIEAWFEKETGQRRCRWMFTSNLVGIAFYLLTLIGDTSLLPDVFGRALALKFGMVVPAFLVTLIVYSRRPPPWLREATVPVLAIFTMGTSIYLMRASSSPFAPYAHYGALIGIVFANLIVRARFYYAVAGSFAPLVINAVGLAGLDALPAEARLSAIATLTVAIACTLFANFQLERDMRRTYLFGLRDRVKAVLLSRANQELSRISSLDPMTGLANRRGLDERLAAMWLAAQASRQPTAVLMVDIDHFKPFNDSYGHQAGDECLKEIAEVLRSEARGGGDLVARYGGEEFIVALPGADLIEGIRAGERLRQAVAARALRHEAAPGKVVTASIGVAAAPANLAISPRDLIEAADVALYEAKKRGRNRVWPPVPATERLHEDRTAGAVIAEVA